MSFRGGGFRRPKQTLTLDLTPLIDCIFQLLVFFLLTASFITTPHLGVELPKASSKAASAQQEDPVFAITRDGKVQFKGKTLEGDLLNTELKALFKKRPKARIRIEADTKAYHGSVVRLMDAAKAAGFRKLGVAIKR